MPSLLAIDDEPNILTIVKTVADGLGFTTATLDNTLHFMTTFVRVKPDVITLDLVMPEMDGIEILRWLTDVDYSGRVIVTSGFADYQAMAIALVEATSKMSVSMLRKPFRVAELREALGHKPTPVQDEQISV